jgi:hypothetical protein
MAAPLLQKADEYNIVKEPNLGNSVFNKIPLWLTHAYTHKAKYRAGPAICLTDTTVAGYLHPKAGGNCFIPEA